MAASSIADLERKHLDAARDQAEAREQYELLCRDADRAGRPHDDDPAVRAARISLKASQELFVRAAREHLDALEAARSQDCSA